MAYFPNLGNNTDVNDTNVPKARKGVLFENGTQMKYMI